jgi:chorismate--pyruvate lyase
MEPVTAIDSDSPPVPWRDAAALDGYPLDEALRCWLQDGGSLTRRLRRLGGRRFHLEVLGEGWEEARDEDLRLLGCSSGRIRVRRVRLSAGQSRLVYASTRMPPATLARHPWLGRLGNKPLGEALADRTDVRRTPFEFAEIPSVDPLLTAAVSGADIPPAKLWTRRSLFYIGQLPILVYEVFLPGLSGYGRD